MSLFRLLKIILLLLILAVVASGTFYFVRTNLSLSLQYEQEVIDPTHEWSVSFGQELYVSDTQITPEVNGTWSTQEGFFGTTALTFKPESAFEKGKKYTVELVLARAYNRAEQIPLPPIIFSVALTPEIISLSIDGGKDDVLQIPDIKLVTTSDFADRNFSLSIVEDDENTINQVLHEGNSTVWRPTNDLPQGKILTLEVHDEYRKLIVSQTFTTVMEPKVVNLYSQQPILPGGKITVLFNTEMQVSTMPLLLDMPGEGMWIDSKTYEYSIGNISPHQTYKIKIPKGVPSEKGGKLIGELSYSLSSPGYLVPSFSVISREPDIYSPIEISFDQPVDHKSAELSFNISPSVKGKFSWRGENLIFAPTKLQYQQTYKVSMAAGVKPKFGLPSENKISTSFTTVPEVYKLNVPYFAQQYSRSCEAASLRMALAYHGVNSNDMEIIKKIGYNPRPKDSQNNVWDDPRIMFVGYASSSEGEGYGVYGAPVARVAEEFGRTSQYTRSLTPQTLAKNIKENKPVVLWGYTSLSVPATEWSVPGGETVVALASEHARVVVGVYGSTTNPLGFYIHDPRSGKQYEYWDTADVMRQFKQVPGVTDQAVVVG